jgi:N-acetyl-anhydromuramyl-L-alanine amidase AmpD
MLEILDVEAFDLDNLRIKKRKYKKSQILLYDTGRKFDFFIKKLKHRNFGNSEDIPHFCITKTGKIYNFLNPEHGSKTFGENKVDNKQIKIALENLGWLNKNTITGIYENWINDVYRSTPHIRSWRSYMYWDPYTQDQLQALADLCLVLCVKYNIDYFCVPSSGYIENAKNIEGIVSKSNFLDIYTDINPSFNFNIFEENVKQTEYRV